MTHRLLQVIGLPKISLGEKRGVLADHLLLISCRFLSEISLAVNENNDYSGRFLKFSCSANGFLESLRNEVPCRMFSIWCNSLQLFWVIVKAVLFHTAKLPQSDFNLAVHV